MYKIQVFRTFGVQHRYRKLAKPGDLRRVEDWFLSWAFPALSGVVNQASRADFKACGSISRTKSISSGNPAEIRMQRFPGSTNGMRTNTSLATSSATTLHLTLFSFLQAGNYSDRRNGSSSSDRSSSSSRIVWSRFFLLLQLPIAFDLPAYIPSFPLFIGKWSREKRSPYVL